MSQPEQSWLTGGWTAVKFRNSACVRANRFKKGQSMSVAFKSVIGAVAIASLTMATSAASAQDFGTSTSAFSQWSYYDTNGQHHPADSCVTALGSCNTAAPYATAVATTQQGAAS